eukprot:278585-Ditylum_brightwellii.AAC.1
MKEDGGMHRHYHHEMKVDIPSSSSSLPSATTDDIKTSIIQNGIITTYHPLSQGVYIDVDDPFVLDGYNSHLNEDNMCIISMITNASTTTTNAVSYSCQLKLITTPNEIIDIEQPSFVSPQHVVGVEIRISNVVVSTATDDDVTALRNNRKEEEDEEDDKMTIKIEYGTRVHVRYPEPNIVSDDGNDDAIMNHMPSLVSPSFVSVHVPKPMLYSGSFQVMDHHHPQCNSEEHLEKDENNLHICNEHLCHLQISTTTEEEEEEDYDIITIATGADSDYYFVMIEKDGMCIKETFGALKRMGVGELVDWLDMWFLGSNKFSFYDKDVEAVA